MDSYNLSDEEEALIRYFKQSANTVGFDGVYSLEPLDRGVVEVANLVRASTLLGVFSALGLKGKDAWDIATRMRNVPAPMDAELVHSQLHKLYRDN